MQGAREFLTVLSLEEFRVTRSALFRQRLDRATDDLLAALPRRARSWGLARKLVNIFLRDALYTAYLRDHFGLDAAEQFYELPLDSITARCLREEDRAGRLPRWHGVTHLTREVSDQYQAAAAAIASARSVARVHLDAYWWGDRRNKDTV